MLRLEPVPLLQFYHRSTCLKDLKNMSVVRGRKRKEKNIPGARDVCVSSPCCWHPATAATAAAAAVAVVAVDAAAVVVAVIVVIEVVVLQLFLRPFLRLSLKVVVMVEVEIATTSAEEIKQSSRDLLRAGSNDL